MGLLTSVKAFRETARTAEARADYDLLLRQGGVRAEDVRGLVAGFQRRAATGPGAREDYDALMTLVEVLPPAPERTYSQAEVDGLVGLVDEAFGEKE